MTQRFHIEILKSTEISEEGKITTSGGEEFSITHWINQDSWEFKCIPEQFGDVSVEDFVQTIGVEGRFIANAPTSDSCNLLYEHRNNPLVLTIISQKDESSPFVGIEIHTCGHIEYFMLCPRLPDVENSSHLKSVVREILSEIGGQSVRVSEESDVNELYWVIKADLASFKLPLSTIWAVSKRVNWIVRFPIELENMSQKSITNLAISGHPEILLGLPENEWLEAKRDPYKLESLPGGLELAKDIAQFANSQQGGILAIGFRTRRIDGRDVIHKIVPFQVTSRVISQMQERIERYVSGRCLN